jgi:ketosteroid isomerase-like protein
MSTEHEVQTFLSRWSAAERDGDTAALDGLLTEDFTGVGPLGFLLSKQEWLDRHTSGDLRYRAFGLDDLRVRSYGDTAVVIAHHAAQGAYRGHGLPEELRATLVVTDAPGSPQLAGVHLSFMAGTPGAPPIPARS